MSQKVYSECLICSKPLGQDTKDLDFRVCLEHRACSICGKELLPLDVHIAFDASKEDMRPLTLENLAHSRCHIAKGRLGVLEADPTISIKQSTYNYLNAARLMVDPDMDLAIITNENNAMIRSREFCQSLVHQMDFDAVYVHLKMLEACVASVSLFVAQQDRKAIKARADVREAEKEKRAKKEALTSSRPAALQSKPDDATEVELSKFMALFGIKDRKLAVQKKRDRDKAILAMVKAGIPMALAEPACTADMLKNLPKGEQIQ